MWFHVSLCCAGFHLYFGCDSMFFYVVQDFIYIFLLRLLQLNCKMLRCQACVYVYCWRFTMRFAYSWFWLKMLIWLGCLRLLDGCWLTSSLGIVFWLFGIGLGCIVCCLALATLLLLTRLCILVPLTTFSFECDAPCSSW